MIRSACHF